MEINELPINAAPNSALNIELSDGQRATLASLPIQSAVTAALALKAPLASPALTGTPTAPTAATGTSTTQIATTDFVQQELAAGGSTARALVVSVRNQSGGTMAAGTIVYLNGATGNLPTIAKALATSDATSAQTIGLVRTSIADNGTGLVVVRGVLGNLNTSGLTEGQQLYLSPTTAGTYTTTKQYAPNHLVYVGIVTRAHPTQGSIEVAVQNGFEMDELHNVSAQSPTNGDTLRYNSATALWENKALGTLAGQNGIFSGTSSGTNTGDQTITLTGDVTGTGAGSFAATIANNAVTNAKAAQVATQTFKGRNTAATGNVEDLSVATAKTMLAISNVDNTSDANKPVSTAQQTALNLKANLASPALTGTPTAPTAVALTNSTQLATTAYADAADLAATAALVEREGLRFDGTAGVPCVISASGLTDFTVSAFFSRTLGLNESLVGTDGISTTAMAIRISDTAVELLLQNDVSIPFLGSVPAQGVLHIVRSSGVSSCFINGLSFGTPTSDTNNYSATDHTLGKSFSGSTPIYLSGSISRFSKFNYALTAGEIAALTRRGLVTLPEQRGGSMVNKIASVSRNSDFSAGATDWVGAGGGSATVVSSALDISGGSADRRATLENSFWGGILKETKYRVTLTVTNFASTGGCRLILGVTDLVIGTITGNGTQSFEFTSNTSNVSASLQIRQQSAGTMTLTVDNISIIPLGTLFEQDSGQRNAGYMVRDTSGNGRHLELPETGVSINDPADTGFIEYTRTTDGYLIGDRRVIPSTGYLFEVVATGNGTVTLGESAGTPANVCASVTLTSTPKILPLLVTQTSTGKLYADLGTATTATFKIRHRTV